MRLHKPKMDIIKFDTKINWMGKIILFLPTLVITFLTIIKFNVESLEIILSSGMPLVIGTLGFWTYTFLAWKYTFYTLNDEVLKARFALFRCKTICITDIKDIKQQNFGIYTYGLSKEVLSIQLKNGDTLNISPKQPEIVIEEIEKRKLKIS